MIYLTPPNPNTLPQDFPAWSAEDAKFNFALEKIRDGRTQHRFLLLFVLAHLADDDDRTVSEYIGRESICPMRERTMSPSCGASPAAAPSIPTPTAGSFRLSSATPASVASSFRTSTRPILDALHSLGVDAQFSGRNDLTIDGKKFSGNAQYIRRGRGAASRLLVVRYGSGGARARGSQCRR